MHEFLTRAYWCPGITVERIRSRVENSLCFGLYEEQKQIGFARVVTDFSSMAYLADVFIIEEYRGRKLSKWLINTIMNYPDLQDMRLWLLRTKDAHGLYRQFGFVPAEAPENLLELRKK